MKVPKSLAKELNLTRIASEKKVAEIVSKMTAAAEQAQMKDVVAGLADAIEELKKHKREMSDDLRRIKVLVAANTEIEYDVEIVRGDDDLAKRFIMRPINDKVLH